MSVRISMKVNRPRHQVHVLTWVIWFHVAPEMFISKPYKYSIDWWAVGIIMFECTYGKVNENDPATIQSREGMEN
jgi:hypothetical protein